jgi:hypothetical protein
MVRMTEAAVAVGFGAADALVAAKVKGLGPGKIPWPVYLEGAGIAAGLFGDKVGIGTEIRDSVLFASLTLAGSRVTRVAMAGALLKGPAAWGGAGGDPTYSLSAGQGGDQLSDGAGGGTRSVRLLAGRRAPSGGVGGASIYPAMSEMAGVAG